MKKIILLLLAIAFVSCQSNEGKMKNEIKAYLDKNAKDPKSYEFVELKILDTVSIADVSKEEIEKMEIENLEYNNIILENQNKILDYQLSNHVELYKKLIEKRNKSIKNYKDFISLNNSMIKKAKKNVSNLNTVGYIYSHKYRLKNGFGALDLSQNYLSFDKNDSLLSFSDSPNYAVFKNLKK